MKEFESDDYRKRPRSKNSEDRYRDSSKKRLLNILKKKFDTTTIGTLAILEESLGDLWGHGIPYRGYI